LVVDGGPCWFSGRENIVVQYCLFVFISYIDLFTRHFSVYAKFFEEGCC